ncbi:heavy metal transporter [Streptomyces sp. 8N706]|uniref:heavy metal transporter n=1 Tax=Streptomyces sp. 8N706 TaxID=3457416 RepID=UPI003FD2FA63
MSQPSSTARRGRLLRIGAACAVLLALAGYLAVHFTTGGPGAPRCVVRGPGENGAAYAMQPEQAANAATIEAVGSSRGLPERAITIALATAMQESGLRNIDYGDRDSVGLFQQRPSQGWGNARQIKDPVYSAGKFYEHLVKVPGYSRLPLTVAAQKVQRSGFPQAYAKHEPDASLLASALTGRTAGAFSCTSPGGDGKRGEPERVRAELIREFGPDVLPRPGAGRDQRATGGSGQVVTVPAEPPSTAAGGGSGRHGWEVAHWAVAHSSELRIAQVSYAGQVWSAGDSGQGWRKAGEGSVPHPAADSDAVIITAAH